MSEESIVSEVLAASLGGAISAGVLYPLEVLKTRMQAVDSSSEGTAEEVAAATKEQEDEEGANAQTSSTISSSPSPSPAKLSMLAFAQKLYRTEGLAVFFRGVEASAFQSALEKALYFFAYTALKEGYSSWTGRDDLDTLTNLLFGYLAEWAHLPISLPVDAWTTRIKTQSNGITQSNGNTGGPRNDGPLKVLLTMLSEKNQNFYKGISAYYLLCFKPALQYTVYEQVKAALLKSRRLRHHAGDPSSHFSTTLSAAEAFLLGMVARTISTVLVFPFLRAKVLLQTQRTMHQNSTTEQDAAAVQTSPASIASSAWMRRGLGKNKTIQVLWQQWQREGWSGLYQGLGPELTRGIFSAALMLMIKERIAALVRNFLLPGGSRPLMAPGVNDKSGSSGRQG